MTMALFIYFFIFVCVCFMRRCTNNSVLQSAPTVDESEEIDNMSQLNPNAEEFVPVSPTRMEQRGTDWTALKDEPILAQSPRRVAANCDFNVPEENDFVEEANNRPSGAYSNGHENVRMH